jgi:hypothetical protein
MSQAAAAVSVESDANKFPSQIKYIVGNEACERYSYYGMRSILTVFMIQVLFMQEGEATSTYHLFASACYLFPLLGAFISDRIWGKYKTILINNYQSFLFWCNNNNLSILQFKKTILNQSEYCKFIEKNYKTKSMLDGVKYAEEFLYKMNKNKQNNLNYLLTNMRMSICELG